MRVTVELMLDAAEAERFYPAYAAGFDPLRTRAAARHLLTPAEFAAEMADPRIEKYVVRAGDGTPLALTTLATDIAAIPWISADYYRARYPGATLFFLGYTVVQPEARGLGALAATASRIEERLLAAEAVAGFDICSWNDEHGVGRHIRKMFQAAGSVGPVDRQTYYVADFRRSGTGEPEVVTLEDRPELAAQVPGLLESQWPAFLLAGRAAHGVNLPELLLATPQHQSLLVAGDELIGAALSVPLSGSMLPDGWDGAVRAAADLVADGRRTDQVCALSITLASHATGRGLAGRMITALKQTAARAGARRLILPVRPTRKADYPLTAMATYLNWRTEHGEMFDPWLRLHARHGAELLGLADPAMTVTGSITDWEKWLGLPLPESGEYVIAGGLAPLTVDHAAGEGFYREANVWMSYRL